MAAKSADQASVPPRWFVRTAWAVHRGIYRFSGGRFGLRRATPSRWGMMHLTTVGRRSGEERGVILGYFKDGPNLVTLAMNGWAEAEPAWWLNMQAHPEVSVKTSSGRTAATGRAAVGDERHRLWARWGDYDEHLDANAALRSSETAVVVIEPH
ncbi:MAG: nitroreductase/quinone reductase family protein, partial [Acidimicrobiia bacterium]